MDVDHSVTDAVEHVVTATNILFPNSGVFDRKELDEAVLSLASSSVHDDVHAGADVWGDELRVRTEEVADLGLGEIIGYLEILD